MSLGKLGLEEFDIHHNRKRSCWTLEQYDSMFPRSREREHGKLVAAVEADTAAARLSGPVPDFLSINCCSLKEICFPSMNLADAAPNESEGLEYTSRNRNIGSKHL